MIDIMRMSHAVRARGVDLALLILLLAVVALTGGTSRSDTLIQVVVRTACFIALAGWTFAGWPRHRPGIFAPLAFTIVAIVICGLQLVPLPPAMWGSFPGRQFYEQAADVAGIAQPWRPLNLTPDRGLAAFFSLVVPLAFVAGLARVAPRQRTGLLLPMVVLVMGSAILGLAQLSGGADSALRWYRISNDESAVGFLANRNHQALLLALGLPTVAAWARLAERGDRRWTQGWIALAIGAFLILMVPTTGSRAGLILGGFGAIAGLAIAAPVMRKRLTRVPRKLRRRFAGAGLAAVVAFVAVLLVFGRNEAIVRLRDLDASGDLRAKSFPIVWKMTTEYFPIGTGFGSFDTMYRRYEPFSFLTRSYLNQAHNDLLQIVMEGGALAAVAVVMFLCWWLWASILVWRAPASPRVIAGRTASAMLVMTIASSAVDYPLRTPLLLAVFTIAVVWLATGASRGSARSDEPV